jgi:hypothetical protein
VADNPVQKPTFTNKPVAVLNKSIEPGKIVNALAHMCFGLGAVTGKEEAKLTNYHDAEGGTHPFISEMPFIILEANSNKIRKLRQQAQENKISFIDFTDTMTVGTYLEQIAQTARTPEADLVYYGIVLFGEWEKVTELTKKFSLWK